MAITEAHRELLRQRISKLDENQIHYVLGYLLRGNEEIITEALVSAERLYPTR
jgi:hypothetical protein